MKKPALISLLIATSALSFLLGSAYGFRDGVHNAFYLDRLPQGVISTYRYKRIQANNIDFTKKDLNLDIDQALDSYDKYLTDGNHLYSRIFLPEHIKNADLYLHRIAEFRAVVPEDDISYALDKSQRAAYEKMAQRRKVLLAKAPRNAP